MPKQTGKPGRPTTRPKNKKRLRAAVKIPGVEQPVWVSGYTRAEIDREKQRVRNEYIDGLKIQNKTFHEVVIEWFDTVKKPKIKTMATLNNWRSAINNHLLPCFQEKKLIRAIRRADLQTCLDKMEGMNQNTILLVKSTISHTFAYAGACGYIQLNPAFELMSPSTLDSEPKRPFTREEETNILHAASNDPDGIIIYLLYYLGLRCGEMLGLQWGDIDFKKKTAHIQRDVDFATAKIGELKNKSANRYVPIPNALMEILSPIRGLPFQHIASEDGHFLSPTQYRTRFFRIMYHAGFARVGERYAKKAERYAQSGRVLRSPQFAFDYDTDFTSHYFRHHYITAKVEIGERPEILMSIVGHSKYDTTIKVYTHIKERINEDEPTLLSETLKAERANFATIANN